jgi:autophagy-related protein 9
MATRATVGELIADKIASAAEFLQEPPTEGRRGAGYNLLGQRDDENPNSLLEHEEVEDQWKFMARDLDRFFTRVYEYYRERGYHCILVANVLNLLLLAFVNYVTATLLLFVDWRKLLECRAHNGCEDITEFVTGHRILQNGSLSELLSLVFTLAITAWWFIQLLNSAQKIRDARDMQRFYRVKLELSDTDLLSKDWADVLEILVERQAPLTLNEHDALDISNRILRQDNYMVALANFNMLPLGLPTISCPFPIPRACIPVSLQRYLGDSLPNEINLPTPPDFFSLTLYHSINYCLLDKMFDSNFRIPEKFLGVDGASELRRRFRMMGFVMLVLAPFITLAMLMYIILKHAETFYKRPSYVTQRRWTLAASWKFREWNEMPHVFDRRIKASYEPADRYVEQFHSELLSLIARFLTFVGGSFAGLCLVIIMINDSLMSTTVYDRNLWWYLAVCGGGLAITRSVAQAPPYGIDPVECFKEVKRYTHFGKGTGVALGTGDPKSTEVVQEFKQLYTPRFAVVLQEFVAILTTPIMLWTVYPQSADRILTFIRENTEREEKVGDVCGFATFNFDKYGDTDYGARRSEYTVHSKRPAREGKMEKSFVNFRASNPAWRSDSVVGLGAFSALLEQSSASLAEEVSGAAAIFGGCAPATAATNCEDSTGGPRPPPLRHPSSPPRGGSGTRAPPPPAAAVAGGGGMGASSIFLMEQAERQAQALRPAITDSMLSAFRAGGAFDAESSLLDSQYMFRHDQGYEALERVRMMRVEGADSGGGRGGLAAHPQLEPEPDLADYPAGYSPHNQV